MIMLMGRRYIQLWELMVLSLEQSILKTKSNEDNENDYKSLKNRLQEQNGKIDCWIVDDCCNSRKFIQEKVDPQINVYQDSKHLLNRPLEHCNKISSLYSKFSQEFHACLTEKKITVLCRDGKTLKEIEGPLLSGETIWKNMLNVYERFKSMETIKLREMQTIIIFKRF